MDDDLDGDGPATVTALRQTAQLFREHLGLFLTAGIFGLLIVRLWGVSHGSMTTAAVLLRYSSAPEVAVATALFLLPWLVMGLVANFMPAVARRGAHWWTAPLVMGGMLIPLGFVISGAYMGVLVLESIAIVLVERAAERRRHRLMRPFTELADVVAGLDERQQNGTLTDDDLSSVRLQIRNARSDLDRYLRRMILLGALVSATLLFVIATLSPPWYPTVAVEFTESDGRGMQGEFLVAKSDTQYVFLSQSGRRVDFVPVSAVESVHPCSYLPGFLWTPLWFSLVATPPQYPSCPS